MKKVFQFALSFVVLSAMIFTIASASGKVKAAEAGTLSSNPIVLTEGEYHTKYWTYSNYDLNCFNMIEAPERGYITFTIQKPFDNEGEIGTFRLVLFDEYGNIVWDANTDEQSDSFSPNYVYKIGVDAGTYFMNLDPGFFVYRDSAPIETLYKYDFTESSYWEIESNDTQTTATSIKLDKMYNGVFSEQTGNTLYTDYFSIKLTKGVKYRIKFDNYEKLNSTTFMLFDVLDANGESIDFGEQKESGTVSYWDFTAPKSGTFYLKIYNSANEAGVEYGIGVYAKQIDVNKLTITLSTTKYSYNGKVKTPTVTVKDGKTTLKEDKHYTVKYSSGRKSIGEYKVTVVFDSDNYNGKRTVTFQIAPAKIDSKKITATQSTSAIKLSWPKTTGATGYYVYQYSPSKEKYVRVGTTSKNSYKRTDLSAGKTYKFKVAAYKKLSSGKIIEATQSSYFKTATKCKAPKFENAYWYSWNEVYLKWTEVNGATGYQVYYSTKKDSGFKKLKSDYSADYDYLYKEFSDSYYGKRVYFKVRAYTKVNGQVIYSDWSKVKGVDFY